MLWILAVVAIALLCYEIPTLLFSVLQPLLANPNTLQTDFHYYYDAARRFSEDTSRLYLASDHVIAGFAYPPPAIAPFVALSTLPLGVALLVMTAASYAALIVAIEMWQSYLSREGISIETRGRIGVLLITIASGPAYMNAVFGQVNALVLLSAVAFVVLAARLPMVSGFTLAAGTWLKIYPAFLVLIGAWDSRMRRAIGFAAAAAIVIPMVLLPLVPLASYESFAGVLRSRADVTAIHITNQSLVAFLERFRYAPELFLHWTGEQAIAVTAPVRAIQAIATAVLVLKLWWESRANRTLLPASAASMMAIVAVIAPLGWGHTYVMVLPLVVLRLIEMRGAPTPIALVIFSCVLALMIPAGRHLPIDTMPSWFQNVVYSRYLLATLALVVIPTMPIGRTTKSLNVASA